MRQKKVHRYSIVTAGRALTGAEMEKGASGIPRYEEGMQGRALRLHGLLSQEDFNRLKEAGVGRYHANIGDFPEKFPEYLYHTYI